MTYSYDRRVTSSDASPDAWVRQVAEESAKASRETAASHQREKDALKEYDTVQAEEKASRPLSGRGAPNARHLQLFQEASQRLAQRADVSIRGAMDVTGPLAGLMQVAIPEDRHRTWQVYKEVEKSYRTLDHTSSDLWSRRKQSPRQQMRSALDTIDQIKDTEAVTRKAWEYIKGLHAP